MKLTNVADACVLIEHDCVRLLTDPWIGGSTYGTWLQYPPPTAAPEEIGRLDYLFISHLHEDHCDFDTINRLDADAKILIMDRRPNLLLGYLTSHGIDPARVVAIPPRTRYRLSDDLEIEPIEPNPAHEYSRLVDSAALFHYGERAIYFANDSEPYEGSDAYIASRYQVDVAMLPFAGGSGYPACYENLSYEEKLADAERIRRAYLESAARCMARLEPRYVMPVASWHVLCGPAAELNPVMSWLPSIDPIEGLLKQLGPGAPSLLLLSPGQGFDLEGELRIGGEYRGWSTADRMDFARTHLREGPFAHERLLHADSIHLDRLFAAACETFAAKVSYTFPDGFRYAFECGDGVRYLIDANTGAASTQAEGEPLTPPYLKVSLDRRLFVLLLIGSASWNIEDVSGFLRYHRDPNRYLPEIHVALNHVRV